MKAPSPPILGIVALRARPTFAGALWLALFLSLPVGVIGLAAELILRWLF